MFIVCNDIIDCNIINLFRVCLFIILLESVIVIDKFIKRSDIKIDDLELIL